MEQFENISHFTVIWNTNTDKEKVITFDRAISGKFIALDHLEVLWNYDNVTSEKENNYISTFDGKDWNRLTFPDGYYTFNALVKELKKQNITLTYDPNTLLSTVETKSALRLRRLGMLLGFDKGIEISANSFATSTNMINIRDGLQVISVLCDKINDSKISLTESVRKFYGRSAHHLIEV